MSTKLFKRQKIIDKLHIFCQIITWSRINFGEKAIYLILWKKLYEDSPKRRKKYKMREREDNIVYKIQPRMDR